MCGCRRWLAVSVVLAALCRLEAAETASGVMPLTLVRNGKPDAVIVVPTAPYTTDKNTLLLLNLDEAPGKAVKDHSGIDRGAESP